MTAHQGALYERRLFVQKGTGVQFPAVAGATGLRLCHGAINSRRIYDSVCF